MVYRYKQHRYNIESFNSINLSLYKIGRRNVVSIKHTKLIDRALIQSSNSTSTITNRSAECWFDQSVLATKMIALIVDSSSHHIRFDRPHVDPRLLYYICWGSQQYKPKKITKISTRLAKNSLDAKYLTTMLCRSNPAIRDGNISNIQSKLSE